MALQTLLIGTGGIGAVVAYGIYINGTSELSLVVRSDYQKVKDEGFRIDSVDYGAIDSWKPKHLYQTVDEAATSEIEYDFVVVATKNIADIIKVEDLIEPVVTAGKTAIVLMQNGFDIGKPLYEKYPKNVIISGVSHCGSHNKNGFIKHAQHDRAKISYFNNPGLPEDLQERSTKAFISIYKNEKNDPEYFPDERWYRYRKLVYNASLNTVCALTNVDTGRLQLWGGLDEISIPAMKEVVAIAKADGCELPEDVVNVVGHGDDGIYFVPSMLDDVRKGNPVELEVILGNVIKVADDLQVEAPILKVLYALLKLKQMTIKEQKGYISVSEQRPPNLKYYT
ncbi:uncharacterized protein PRCAT00003961001 [Priceomyces carsonii]|uniref:uncharacterized protein n=1 Tax=Priceomyces carsonii TaxID=28549 RepID=UPI002ED8CA0F|nr:unnamed protein product [Priceomyces carsonii]